MNACNLVGAKARAHACACASAGAHAGWSCAVGGRTGGHARGLEQVGAPVQGLAAENAAEGAVVAGANLPDNLVHGPAVQLLVGHDGEGDAVLRLIALDGVQGVVAVAADALVHGQQQEVQAVVVPGVQQGQHMRQYGGVLAACMQAQPPPGHSGVVASALPERQAVGLAQHLA